MQEPEKIDFLVHCEACIEICTKMIKTQLSLSFLKWNPTICTCDLRKKVEIIHIILTLHISSILIVQA